VLSFSSRFVTRFELGRLQRIYIELLDVFLLPQFMEIQPNQSVLIEFPSQRLLTKRLQSLVMNYYGQKLREDTSKFGCLTLCPEVYPSSTKISTFLTTNQFPNVLVLILYDIKNYIKIMESLSQENFKSLKYIVTLESEDDKTKWFEYLYLFPLTQPIMSVKTIFSTTERFQVFPPNHHSTCIDPQTDTIQQYELWKNEICQTEEVQNEILENRRIEDLRKEIVEEKRLRKERRQNQILLNQRRQHEIRQNQIRQHEIRQNQNPRSQNPLNQNPLNQKRPKKKNLGKGRNGSRNGPRNGPR